MADDVIRFPPDSTASGAKQVVFNRNTLPGVTGDVYYQYVRLAQPPTYMCAVDNSMAVSGKNHLTIFNRTARRLRVEHIYAHPHTANNSGIPVVLQVGVTVTEPTDGTTIQVRKYASDFADNPAAPNDLMVRTGATMATISGYFLGGGIVNMGSNTQQKITATLFKKDVDHSSMQLLNGEGVVIKQANGTGSGSMSVYAIVTLDTT